MNEHTLYAARDPQGIRPLVLGRLERGCVVASESAALDICGAAYVREIEPASSSPSTRTACGRPDSRKRSPRAVSSSTCIWPARNSTDIAGRNVYLSRVEMGRKLAKEAPVRPIW